MITKLDILDYIELKTVEDYEYEDVVIVLNQKIKYEKLPDTFIQFMGRIIEDTLIRLDKCWNCPEHTDEYIRIPKENNFPIHISYYGIEGVFRYTTDKIMSCMDKQEIKEFLEYYKETIIRLEGKHSGQNGGDIFDKGKLTYERINLYINNYTDGYGELVHYGEDNNSELEDKFKQFKEYDKESLQRVASVIVPLIK